MNNLTRSLLCLGAPALLACATPASASAPTQSAPSSGTAPTQPASPPANEARTTTPAHELTQAPAHATPSPALLLLSKRDETLAIVDPRSLEVLAKVPVGHDPHEVIATTDGQTAYVSNYGHGTFHTLAVIDLVHPQALAPIELGGLRGPHGLFATPGKIWFTAEGAKAIGSVDTASGKIDWILGTGQDRTHMLSVSSDRRRIVTTNVESGTISILERVPGKPHPMGPPEPSWEQTVIEVGHGTEGFDVSPDEKEIWGADADDGSVVIVDARSKKVVQRIAAGLRGANRLKFTPDGKRVFVSTLRGPAVAVFDAATRQELKRIPVGHGASGILMQPDGARAYVACSPDGNVAVIDLKTLEVVGRIEPGGEPDGMAWAVRP